MSSPRRRRSAVSAAPLLATIAAIACGPSVPGPRTAPPLEVSYTEVPYPPPPADPEELPESPREGAVWVDGQWLFRGGRWVWDPGGWVMPPEGARYAPWALARRRDGVLVWAEGAWRGPDGELVKPPVVLAPPRDEVPWDPTRPRVRCPPPPPEGAAAPGGCREEPR